MHVTLVINSFSENVDVYVANLCPFTSLRRSIRFLGSPEKESIGRYIDLVKFMLSRYVIIFLANEEKTGVELTAMKKE